MTRLTKSWPVKPLWNSPCIPGDLDRVFIETSPSVIQLLAAEIAIAAGSRPRRQHRPRADAQTTRPHHRPHPRDLARRSPPQPAVPEPLSPDAALAFEATAAALAAVSGTARYSGCRPARIWDWRCPRRVRLEMLSSFTHAELPPINAPSRRLPYGVWLVGRGALGRALDRSAHRWVIAHGSPSTRRCW